MKVRIQNATAKGTVTKFKTFAVTMLAVVTVTVGGLAAPPTASAQPMSCSTARTMSRIWATMSTLFWLQGNFSEADKFAYMSTTATLVACNE